MAPEKRKRAEREGLSITLLVVHPSASLSSLASDLGFRPDRSWDKGEARTTPTGRELAGKWPDSRWTKTWRGKRNTGAVALMSDVLDEIEAGMKTFSSLRGRGARVEIILRFWAFDHFGETFDQATMRRLTDLGLDFGVEYFSEPQR